jgi:hypothetical protein
LPSAITVGWCAFTVLARLTAASPYQCLHARTSTDAYRHTARRLVSLSKPAVAVPAAATSHHFPPSLSLSLPRTVRSAGAAAAAVPTAVLAMRSSTS